MWKIMLENPGITIVCHWSSHFGHTTFHISNRKELTCEKRQSFMNISSVHGLFAQYNPKSVYWNIINLKL